MKKLKIKKEYVIVIILIITVIFIVFSTFYDKDNSQNTTNSTNEYVLNLERRLEQSIEQIEGVKNATVLISVDGGITTLIAEDVKKVDENGKVTYTSSPVLVGGEPIVLGEVYPKITGVIVVCDCNGNFAINSYVLDVITTALSIPCDKITILTQ